MEVENLSQAVTNHSRLSLMTLFNQDDHIDRISGLPCNVVIDGILAHLAIKDLVRTSVLSKKWRYMRTKAPQLCFDEDFFREYEGEDLDDPCLEAFKIIMDVLMQHNGPIEKFVLSVPYECDHKITTESFNTWIPFLSRRNIQHLAFFVCGTYDLGQMPYHVLSCKELTYLSFSSFNLSIPHDFRGFKRLLNLHLYHVTFEFVELESLISSCPLLKKLDIEGCDGFKYFDLSTPTLEVLRLEFQQDMKSICLKKSKNLTDLTILAIEVWVFSLIKSLPKKIQRLTISSHICNNKIIPYADIIPPTLVQSSFSFIKYLKFCGVHLNERGELLHIVSVLKSAHSLIELDILIDDVDCAPQVPGHLGELQCSNCCLKLQTVNISVRVRASSQHAMSLTQFILANSTSLKTLTFNACICPMTLDGPLLVRISQCLLWMKRASQRAHIKFRHSSYWL